MDNVEIPIPTRQSNSMILSFQIQQFLTLLFLNNPKFSLFQNFITFERSLFVKRV